MVTGELREFEQIILPHACGEFDLWYNYGQILHVIRVVGWGDTLIGTLELLCKKINVSAYLSYSLEPTQQI